MPTTPPIEPRPALPGLALSLGVTWLLAGAVYKLFDGNVADLPKTVFEHSPFESKYDTFRYAIAAELAVVGLVFALPRFAWLLLAGTFGVFLAALYPLWREGADSCGCFGGTVEIRPEYMMLIDGGLMLFILLSRPWRMAKGAGLGPLAALALVAAGVAAPLVKLEPMDETPVPAADMDALRARAEAAAQGDAAEGSGAGGGAVDVSEGAVEADVGAMADGADEGPGSADGDAGTAATDGDEPSGEEGADDPAQPTDAAEAVDPADAGAASSAEDTTPDTPPAPADTGLPPFMELDFESWVGTNAFDLPFLSIANTDQGFFMPGAHVVVYRQTCDVCKEHLEDLQLDVQQNPQKWEGRPIVLLRIEEKTDTPENNICVVLPEPSQKMSLPALEKGYLATTPISFDLDEEMNITEVTNVREELGH